jgi:hypothetical protein
MLCVYVSCVMPSRGQKHARDCCPTRFRQTAYWRRFQVNGGDTFEHTRPHKIAKQWLAYELAGILEIFRSIQYSEPLYSQPEMRKIASVCYCNE